MTTRPAMRARMGSTNYFSVTLSVRELLAVARVASESDEWGSLTIDERIQREVNLARINKTIVPYLVGHEDRFFGSFILLAPAGIPLEFEALSELVATLPAAYRSTSESVGYLTLPDQGQLIALDGQHRLTALREVVLKAVQLGGNALSVADDLVTAIIIQFESTEKTRRIFNKVNRNAKPTGKSDNIITSEDDGFAIVTRRLLSTQYHGPFADRVVNGSPWQVVEWTSTALASKSDRFTTLSALYEGTSELLRVAGYQGFSEADDPVAPPDEVLDEATAFACSWFTVWVESAVIAKLLSDPEDLPRIRMSAVHRSSLLTRPVGQIACLRGLIQAWAMEPERTLESLAVLAARLEDIDWSASPLNCWRDLIVRADGSMLARKEGIELAADLVTYLISPHYPSDATTQLFQDWNRKRGKDPFSPIEDVAEDVLPEELPGIVWR